MRGPRAASIRAGSRLKPSRSTSAKTGEAPVQRIASTVAKYVNGGVTTSSPGPTPSATSASQSASVPEPTPMQCRVPTRSAIACSNAAVSGPRMYWPERSTRSTAASTSAPTSAHSAARSTFGIRGDTARYDSAMPSHASLLERYSRGRAAQRRARGAALGRGPGAPVDARREPDQVAPRAHELVLRDLRARGAVAGLPPLPSRLPRALQLLLQDRRRAVRARAARPALAPDARRGAAPIARHVDAAIERAARERARISTRALRRRRARPPARAAAPGADPHRREAPARAEPAAAGLPRGASAPAPRARPRRSRGIALRRRGCAQIGHAGAGFAFDNERPRHRVFLAAFELASRAGHATASTWQFIDDGGYRDPALWLSDGWRAVRARAVDAPLYWERRDGAWWVQTLGGPRAAARRGARLPRELLRGRRLRALGGRAAADRGRVGGRRARRRRRRGQLRRERPAPPARPAPSPRAGDALAAALRRRLGMDGQRLRALPRLPRRRPGALGEYNGKFMCNQIVLRGGSCATPRSHIRAELPELLPARTPAGSSRDPAAPATPEPSAPPRAALPPNASVRSTDESLHSPCARRRPRRPSRSRWTWLGLDFRQICARDGARCSRSSWRRGCATRGHRRARQARLSRRPLRGRRADLAREPRRGRGRRRRRSAAHAEPAHAREPPDPGARYDEAKPLLERWMDIKEQAAPRSPIPTSPTASTRWPASTWCRAISTQAHALRALGPGARERR